VDTEFTVMTCLKRPDICQIERDDISGLIKFGASNAMQFGSHQGH